MPRRVELDQTQAPVTVPARILQELCAHALETLPEECCGLVVGNSLERYRRLVRCRNDMTLLNRQDPVTYPRDGRSAFFMNPHDYDKAAKEAEEAGEAVTAIYHSHVGAGPYLSEMDMEYAEHPAFPFPTADQIVLPVYERMVRDVALFRRIDGRFVGHPIEPVDP